MWPTVLLPSPAAFPPQRVSVSPMEEGVITAGGQYTLQCNISRVTTLAPSTLLEVMWLDPSNNTITSGTTYTISNMSSTTATTLTSTLTFPRLTTSQGGLYSCAVNMTIPDIVTDHQVISAVNVPIRVASRNEDLIIAYTLTGMILVVLCISIAILVVIFRRRCSRKWLLKNKQNSE